MSIQFRHGPGKRLAGQPQQPLTPDWSNPLLENCDFILLGSQQFFNPKNVALTRVGAVLQSNGASGVAGLFGSGNYVYYPDVSSNGGTYPWTIAGIFAPYGSINPGLTLAGTCSSPGGGQYDRQLMTNSSNAAWDGYAYVGGSTLHARSSRIPQVGVFDTVIVTSDAATTLVCAVAGYADVAVASSSAGYTGYTNPVICVGNSSAIGIQPFECPLFIRTRGYWTPAMRASFNANPWQIFTQKSRIWTPQDRILKFRHGPVKPATSQPQAAAIPAPQFKFRSLLLPSGLGLQDASGNDSFGNWASSGTVLNKTANFGRVLNLNSSGVFTNTTTAPVALPCTWVFIGLGTASISNFVLGGAGNLSALYPRISFTTLSGNPSVSCVNAASTGGTATSSAAALAEGEPFVAVFTVDATGIPSVFFRGKKDTAVSPGGTLGPYTGMKIGAYPTNGTPFVYAGSIGCVAILPYVLPDSTALSISESVASAWQILSAPKSRIWTPADNPVAMRHGPTFARPVTSQPSSTSLSVSPEWGIKPEFVFVGSNPTIDYSGNGSFVNSSSQTRIVTPQGIGAQWTNASDAGTTRANGSTAYHSSVTFIAILRMAGSRAYQEVLGSFHTSANHGLSFGDGAGSGTALSITASGVLVAPSFITLTAGVTYAVIASSNFVTGAYYVIAQPLNGGAQLTTSSSSFTCIPYGGDGTYGIGSCDPGYAWNGDLELGVMSFNFMPQAVAQTLLNQGLWSLFASPRSRIWVPKPKKIALLSSPGMSGITSTGGYPQVTRS